MLRKQRQLYGQAALVSLPLVWMISVTIGFALVFWGFSGGDFSEAVKSSGSSLHAGLRNRPAAAWCGSRSSKPPSGSAWWPC